MNRESRKQRNALSAALSHGFKTRIDVLRDKVGSTTEAIVATSLSVVIIGMIASGAVSDMTALTIASGNAERTSQVNAMVGKPELIPAWKTAIAASIVEPVALSSSAAIINTNLWAVPSATGVLYRVSMPRVTNTTAAGIAKCKSIVNNEGTLCVYASAFKAKDVRTIMPIAPAGLAVTNLTNPIAARAIVALAPAPIDPVGTTPASTTLWRFYVAASAVGADGTLTFQQGAVTLKDLPIYRTADGYYGSITVTAGTAAAPAPQITVFSPDRTIAFTRFVLYRTGLQ